METAKSFSWRPHNDPPPKTHPPLPRTLRPMPRAAVQDFTACLFALAGLALVAELILGMFGR